jgi:hypothetical protein
MVSRDYTKEIGLHAQNEVVPLPIAIVILLAIVAGIWLGVSRMQSKHSVAKAEAVDPQSVQVFVRQ